MSNKTLIIKAAMFSLSALLLSCSTDNLAGGNSSQTGNQGIVVLSASGSISGSTVPGARLSIYNQDYRPYVTPPGFSDSTVADAEGGFSITPGGEGYYNLFVFNPTGNRASFLCSIPVFADSTFSDSLHILKPPGYIAGNLTDSSGATYPLSYVYVAGSPYYAVTRNDGGFEIGPLPAGTYATGFLANFMLVDSQTGAMVRYQSLKNTDMKTITVLPDSVSEWHW